ncbi:MAG: trypsin-like peptidase domain-containing protein [Acidobacteriota bacterium]
MEVVIITVLFSLAPLLLISAMADQLAKSKQLSTPSSEVRELVRRATSAVGLVTVHNQNEASKPRPRGSAVIIRDYGLVVTNLHVVTNEKTQSIYDELLFNLATNDESRSWHRYRLKVLAINRERDLVLLKIISDAEGKPLPTGFVFPIVQLGDSHCLKLLDDLFIIGYPEKGGTTITVNIGLVEGLDHLDDWIKTDARLIHGNSGGAALDREGKLIGIPTKVVIDSQRIDNDGDGFPDQIRNYGAIGYLRPAHLVTSLIAQLDDKEQPVIVATVSLIAVHGVIRSAQGRPIAGARVGLISINDEEVTPTNLLTWGGTNAAGDFELNKPVPPGRYKLKIKALGYEPHTVQVEVAPGMQQLVVALQPLSTP